MSVLGRETSRQTLTASSFGKPPASHQAAVSHLRCHLRSVSVPCCLSDTDLLSIDCMRSQHQAPHLSDLWDLFMPRISVRQAQPRSCDKEAGPISLVPDQPLPWVPFSATSAGLPDPQSHGQGLPRKQPGVQEREQSRWDSERRVLCWAPRVSRPPQAERLMRRLQTWAQ